MEEPSKEASVSPKELLTSADPWRGYTELLAKEQPFYDPAERTHYLARASHVRDALRHPSLITGFPFRATRQLFGPTAIDVDGSKHRAARRLVTWFTARYMPTWMDVAIRPVVNDLLNAIPSGVPLDVMTTFAQPLPTRVVCGVMGVGDEVWRRVWTALETISRYVAGQRSVLWPDVKNARAVLVEISEIALSGNAPEGTILHYLSTHDEIRKTFSANEILGSALLLFAAGVVTTTAAIGNLFTCLARYPKTWEDVRASPETADKVITESLRLLPPLHSTVRFAQADLDIEGHTIQRGATVQLLLAAANRDPAHFEEANRWNPDRSFKAINTFGGGPHTCTGTQLVNAELRYLLTEIMARFDQIVVEPPSDFQSAPFYQPTKVIATFTPRQA